MYVVQPWKLSTQCCFFPPPHKSSIQNDQIVVDLTFTTCTKQT